MCGCFLARDRPITSDRCSCCGGDEEYNPRHDKHLDERVLSVLISGVHEGGWTNIARALGTDDFKAVYDSVCRLRRAGWIIEGRRSQGYALRGKIDP